MTDTIPSPQAPTPQMKAELSFSPVFNLAFQQNAIPFVQELLLTNLSPSPLTDLTCTFRSVPDMILPKTVHVELIGAEETLALHDIGVELRYDWHSCPRRSEVH